MRHDTSDFRQKLVGKLLHEFASPQLILDLIQHLNIIDECNDMLVLFHQFFRYFFVDGGAAVEHLFEEIADCSLDLFVHADLFCCFYVEKNDSCEITCFHVFYLVVCVEEGGDEEKYSLISWLDLVLDLHFAVLEVIGEEVGDELWFCFQE